MVAAIGVLLPDNLLLGPASTPSSLGFICLIKVMDYIGSFIMLSTSEPCAAALLK